jgi:Fe-S-cluster containining protein
MNACQTCGACCVSLRVSFPADEVDDRPGGDVPVGMTEPYGNVACMRTNAEGRCVALRGAVGQSVSCAIYEWRPSSCREFAPLAALGQGDDACNEVRRRCGLQVLGTGSEVVS